MKILLCEDERALSRAISKLLEKNFCIVDAAYDGCEALECLRAGEYDACILDIMMPKLDGIEVLKTMRGWGNNTPVLILTAKSEIDEIVRGLDLGANYYLTKPFDAKELLAALRAITRPRGGGDTNLRLGNITLSRTSYELSSPTGSFRLTGKEYQLMETFLSNPNIVLSAERLFEKIWGFESEAQINVVWVYISYLRKKLSALKADIQISVLRGAGYSLEKMK